MASGYWLFNGNNCVTGSPTQLYTTYPSGGAPIVIGAVFQTPSGSASYTVTSNPTFSSTLSGIFVDTTTNLGICPSATPTPTVTQTATPTRTPNPCPSSFGYGGTVSIYPTSTQACANQTCGRSYHLAQPSWSPGYIVYNDVCLTSPFNGGGNWIAVATSVGTYCGGGWAAVQIDSNGVILNLIGCPLTPSSSPVATATNTMTPSVTQTETPTQTPTITVPPTNTPTNSLTPTLSPTLSNTPTNSLTPTITPTFTPTNSQTPTLTPTQTQTATPATTVSNTPTYTPTETPTLTPTLTASPTGTPGASVTPTTTQTETPTLTPSQTPTSSLTPTFTPTNSVTPTVTPIVCGWGVTAGSYVYFDCCGVQQVGTSVGTLVTLDYSYPFTVGITKLNTVATVPCASATPTKTPTLTPTPTYTPTVSPTNTPTNAITPSCTKTPTRTPVYQLVNECVPIVLFDLGVRCNVIKLPSSSNATDGILSLIITGGTTPYSIYWNGVLGQQTLSNIGPGIYRATVIDYYGDYTANTVCSMVLPTSTPTQTATLSPTPTKTPECAPICLYAVGQDSWGPAQFVCNGFVNGKQSWTWLGDVNIVWKTTRWEMVGPDLTTPISFLQGGGILASTSPNTPPLSNWSVFGGTQNYTVTAISGTCPPFIPLQATVTKSNSTCNGLTNCDGSITVSASQGAPPYQYSINGGLNWVTSNIFQGLCPNTYTVLTKDSSGIQVSNVVTISFNQTPTTYQIQITPNPRLTQQQQSQNYSQQILFANVQVVPPLPAGLTITAVLNLRGVKTTYGPGSGLFSSVYEIKKNGNLISPISNTNSTQDGDRPNCNPETYTANTQNLGYSITIGNSDVIEIKTSSTISITNGQIGAQSNCTTLMEEIISANIAQANIQGCSCCSVVPDQSLVELNDNSVQYTTAVGSTCTLLTFTLPGKDASVSCGGNVMVTVTMSPSPYNLDTLDLSDITAILYPETGCIGTPTRFSYNLSTTLAIGTATTNICSTSNLSFQSYNISNVVIDGVSYNDGDTFTKNGRCYTVKLIGCVS